MSYYKNNLSFLLSLTCFHLLIVSAEDYCCTSSHSMTHHTRYDSSGRVISPTQRPVPHNTHKRQTTMPPAGLEPAIPASERP
jgi:hypothetical protein